MALAAFVRGANVGGRRRFRPSAVAKELHRFDVARVGAGGTLVVRNPRARATFARALRQRLPSPAEVADGRVLNQLAVWAPDPAIRHTILVKNPVRLYGFDPTRGRSREAISAGRFGEAIVEDSRAAPSVLRFAHGATRRRCCVIACGGVPPPNGRLAGGIPRVQYSHASKSPTDGESTSP